jgi:MFS family permease
LTGLWRSRCAVSLVFFANGTGFAIWAAELPAIKARLSLTDGELSVALFAFALGALIVMPFAGYLAAKLGAMPTTTAAGLCSAGFLATVPAAPDVMHLVAGACLMGIAQGVLDVAMNVQATTIDRAWRAPILASIHALFYVGGLAGATFAARLFAMGWEAPHVAIALAGLVALVIVGAASFAQPTISPSPGAARGILLPKRAVFRVGVMVFLGFFVEGAMMDWGTVYVASLEGVPASVPAWSFAVFAAGMVAGRLTGDRFTALWGARTLLRASGLVAACGLMLAAITTSPAVVLASYSVVGLGLANVVPRLFAAAARIPTVPGAISIAMVSTMGYSGALGGPPLVGLAADTVGLPSALALVSLAALVVGVAGPGIISTALQGKA